MSESVLADAVLVDRVLAGFDDAFDELYRRHVESAWRVAQAVTGNGHDASDAVSEAFAKVFQAVKDGRLEEGTAFRSYLLTSTRNAGLDILRRSGKLRTGAEDELDLVTAAGPGPAEHLAGAEDAQLVAEAFRNLPERWRSVLWLTEVEGVATKDAAATLGLTANGAAQLAVRARAGLRERFLQAHLRGEVAPDCRFTVDRLGAYVGGGISPRDLAKVDQHLAGCADCRARKDELEELGTSLRRIALPIPLALAGLSAAKVKAVLASSHTAAAATTPFARITELATNPTPVMRRFTSAAAAGVLALGILALPFASTNTNDDPRFARRPVRSAAAPVVNLPTATLTESSTASDTFGSPVTATAPPSDDAVLAPTGWTPTGAPSSAPGTGGPPGAPTEQQDQPRSDEPAPTPAPAASDPLGGSVDVGAGVNLGDHDAGLAIVVSNDPAIGIAVDDQVIGTAPVTTPEEPGVSVTLGPVGTIGLP